MKCNRSYQNTYIIHVKKISLLPAVPVTGTHTKSPAMWNFSFQLVSGMNPFDLNIPFSIDQTS